MVGERRGGFWNGLPLLRVGIPGDLHNLMPEEEEEEVGNNDTGKKEEERQRLIGFYGGGKGRERMKYW